MKYKDIFLYIIMNKRINEIYKNELINYEYVENEDILKIPLGTHIKYISKNSLIKKGGFLKEIKNSSVLELLNIQKKNKYYVYTKNNYIFYKKHDKLRNLLQTLVDSEFKIKKSS